MRNTILKAILYPLFFLFCLVFFLVRGFPIQLVADQLTHQAEQATGMKVTTGGLSMLFPNGVEISEIRLLKEAEEGSPPLTLLVDRLKARVSLFSLLSGKTNVSFSSELLSGKLDGEVNLAPEEWHIVAHSHALDLEKLPIWLKLIGLNLNGKLTSVVDLEINPKDFKDARGSISLDLEQGKLGDGQIQSGWGPVTVPWISLGKTEVTLNLQKGKADIKTFKVASDDLDATLDGYFLLQERFSQISARCKARFKISDDFLKRNPKFDILGQKLAEARGNDGFYSYTVFGPLAQPQFRPLKQ